MRLQSDENKNNEFPPLPKCSITLSSGFSSKLRLIFHASITILFLSNYTCSMVKKLENIYIFFIIIIIFFFFFA